jgi:hypothetical protein
MDMRWVLPTCPMHLNPHIYTAYAVRILESQSDQTDAGALRSLYANSLLKECEKSPGLITTFPGQGIASHDDLYGGSFLCPSLAGRALDYLDRTDGVYRETEPTIFRFLFLKPALKSWAEGFSVGYLSQLQFALHCMFHLATAKPGETSDHLMIWLAIPSMRKFPLSSIFIDIWVRVWTKRGMTPRIVFTAYYLTEVPWFAKFALDDWTA